MKFGYGQMLQTKEEEKVFGAQHPTVHLYEEEASLYSCKSCWDDDTNVAVVFKGQDQEVATRPDEEVGSPRGQVYFIRHGESTANEANVYSGVTDVSLTKFGILQAQAAGRDLKKKGTKPDVVYTSHLVRTRRTAAVALHTAGLVPNDDPAGTDFWPTNLQPICKPSLAERSFGIFTGENKVLLRRALGHEEFERMVHSPSEAPPCAETIGSIYRRCQVFHHAEIIPRLSRGETILVVAHQYVLEAYALVLEGLPPSDYYSFSLPNGKALSADDMKKYRYQTTSAWQKRIDALGDKTILHGTKIAAALFVLGVIIRSLPSLWGQPVTHISFAYIFQAIITLCLAVSSWFVYLEIDLSNAAANTPRLESTIVAAVYLLRIVAVAILGLVLLQDTNLAPEMLESLEWWMLLFAVPPALTTPTISLTWGGKVYLTAIWSSILNAVCGFVLLGLALSPWIGLEATALIPFGIVFVVALLLPALAGQAYRSWKPIDCKKYSKKWKFLGVVAFDCMGLAAGLHLTPATLFRDMMDEVSLQSGHGGSYNCIRQFQIAIVVYATMRVTALLASRFAVTWNRSSKTTPPSRASSTPKTSSLPTTTTPSTGINVDVYILLSQHNIFLWIAMASGIIHQHPDDYYDNDDGTTSGGSAVVYTAFWATTLFFLIPALEETILVQQLAKRLLNTALSRGKVKERGDELNSVWKELSSKFVPEDEVTDFFQD